MLVAVVVRGCSNAVAATVATATAEAEAEATTVSTGTDTSAGAGAGAARAESASSGCLRFIASTNNCSLTFRAFPVFLLLHPSVCPSVYSAR